ncbi:hypothetical protein E2C01_016717 [Portunus trituberculatus]|uniref:Uncharacterized protein n=1 Tax=Portunus trituberculatus TaxID=210409 RepID=A0A5B7DQK8_PORTR|nr:hypothetical protein [Portunus trituberculatus]
MDQWKMEQHIYFCHPTSPLCSWRAPSAPRRPPARSGSAILVKPSTQQTFDMA